MVKMGLLQVLLSARYIELSLPRSRLVTFRIDPLSADVRYRGGQPLN